MHKDRIKGSAKQAEGRLQKAEGNLTGSKSLEAEGLVEKAEGTAQKTLCKAKDAPWKG